jgi:hypothetical protein
MNKWIHHRSPLNTKNMYTIIRLSSIIFFMTFMLSSCDKDPLDACAEDPTCEYFRCKVNGEWWTPDCEDGPLFGCRHTDVQYYKDSSGGSLEMSTSSKKNNEGFIFRIWNVKRININLSYKRVNKIDSRFYEDNFDFYVDTTKNSEFILTSLDTVSFMMSARFSFTGVDESGKTVSITNGEFRQKYRF